jgi:hypothetical protein
MSTIPAPGRLRQEGLEFKASLGYIATLSHRLPSLMVTVKQAMVSVLRAQVNPHGAQRWFARVLAQVGKQEVKNPPGWGSRS